MVTVWLLVCLHAARGQESPVPPEMQKALEEFRVQTRNLGMRQDSPPRVAARGAATPPWHGRVYENFRNDFLDAVPHEIKQGGGAKSVLRRNQFGFNASGPLVIPKIYHGGRRTFLSVFFEGVRDRTSRSFLETIATGPERRGDFSATVDDSGTPLVLYDPEATSPNPAFDPSQAVSASNLQYFRSPFPGNIIPQERLSPVAQAALGYYPAPNVAIGPYDKNNFFQVDPETNNANGVIIKLDHSVGERHRVSVETALSNGLERPARRILSPANPGMPTREFQSRRGGLEHVFTRTPREVVTFGFMGETEISTTGGRGREDFTARIGLPGSGGLAFPSFWFSPYLQMGRASPQARNSRTSYAWEGGYSLRLNQHSLRFTVRYVREQVNVYSSRYPAGMLTFGNGLTSLPGIVNTGHAFGSFLLGMPYYAEKTYAVSPSYFRRQLWTASVREQFELSKALTLSVSLSLAATSPRTEKYDRQSTVDLQAINPVNGRPGAAVVAGRDGRGRAFRPHLVKLQPRAGIAWSPGGDARTVLRAGYSRYYSAGMISSFQWGTQAFNASPSYTSPNSQLEPVFRLRDGIPPLTHPLPDFRPEAANDTAADLFDATSRQPTYQSFELSAERRLPGGLLVSAGGEYETGRNVLVGTNAARPNAAPLSALVFRDLLYDEEFNRSIRPYPQYKNFELGNAYPHGRYARTSAFARIEARVSSGLNFAIRYEASRQYDDYSGMYPRQDYYNSRNEWSLSAFNAPHRLTVTYVYEIPVGPGKRLRVSRAWLNRIVEGWAVSGSTSVLGGEPILLRPLFNNTGGIVPGLRVNVVEGVDPRVGKPGPEAWFNPAAFGQPADFTLGNGPRTHPVLRNPLNQNHDLSMTKRITLKRETTLEINAVGLNFLNHANWTNPDPVIGSASSPNTNAGRITGSFGGRVMQLGVRISF